MDRTEVQVTMTNWAIPLTPRPTVGFTGEHDVTEFEVLTTPENGVTYYLEVKAWRKEPNNILFDKESDRLTVRLTSEMLGAAGIHKAQVVAYLTDGDDTPIKKSNIFEIEVKNSINATKDVEPHYQSALEQWTEILNEKGGTNNYLDLNNKPKINSIELSGDKSLNDLGIQAELTAGANINIEDDVISVDDDIPRSNELNQKIGEVKSEVYEVEVTEFISGRAKNSSTATAIGKELQIESSSTWKYTSIDVGDYKDYKITFHSPRSAYPYYIVGVDENNIITEIHGEATPEAGTTQTVEFTCLSNTVALIVSNYSLDTDTTFSVKEKRYIPLQEQIDELHSDVENIDKLQSDFEYKVGNVKQEYIELDITDFTSGRVKNNVSVGAELQTESSTTWEYTAVDVGDYKDYKIIFRSPASSYSHYIVGVDENNIVTEIHGEATPDAATTQTVEFTCLSTTKTIYISNFHLSTDTTFSVKEKRFISLQNQINAIVEDIENLKNTVTYSMSVANFNSANFDNMNDTRSIILYL